MFDNVGGRAVAIVGMGPRGLSVLERLLVAAAEGPTADLRIWTFDPGEPGAGRIWRTTQPLWFMMNTAAGEVSLFSGASDDGPPRPGSGPSLAEWLRTRPRWSHLGPDDYAPRAVYGEYLRFVFDAFVTHAPAGVTVHAVRAAVGRVRKADGLRIVHFGAARSVTVDDVVLTTGHSRDVDNPADERLRRFAAAGCGLHDIQGDSAADLPLDDIGAGDPVGIIGLGLTFFDVLTGLTQGRGGRFDTGPDGALRYRPSGREPIIAAGSRSGLVMLARGRNQKAPDHRHRPVFATDAAIAEARRRTQRRTGSAQLDFDRDVRPLLQQEVDHCYYTTHVRRGRGDDAAELFAARHRVVGSDPASRARLLDEFGLDHLDPVDLDALAKPFRGEVFAGPEAFHTRLLGVLDGDLADAAQGNIGNPLKAALDILRDTRGSVRQAVDFGGLHPRSHHDDFLGRFNPVNTMVSAGPPAIRVAQTCALIRCGVLTVVGPDLTVTGADGAFVLSSPAVDGSARAVSWLLDGRIPRPSVRRDTNPLISSLFADGAISEYVNTEPTGEGFPTGAIAVTRAPFRAVDAAGRVDPHLYVLGIPTENQRWFTQIGNGRPGPLSGFHADADAIARHVLRRAARRGGVVPAAARSLDLPTAAAS